MGDPPLFVVTLVDPLILGDPLGCREGVHRLWCIRGRNMDCNNNLLGCLGDPLRCLGDPLGCLGDPLGCLGNPLGCLGDPLGCLGDHLGCLGNPLKCLDDPLGYQSDLFETVGAPTPRGDFGCPLLDSG
jgi:hypothetical protein